MKPILLTDLKLLQLAEGITARVVNAENMSIAHVHLDKGAILAEHTHANEQVVNVIKGELELTVAGTTHLLEHGKVMVLPSNVPHSGRAKTDVEAIDVFYPVREDFVRAMSEGD